MAMGMEIASLFAKVGADVGDFNKAMSGVRDELTGGEKSVNKFADVAGAAFKVVAAAALTLGVTIAGVVGSSVLAAADMEQGIADIGAMMALTGDETAKLQDHIMDLGLSPDLKVSATEAAGAVMSLGTAGLDMAEIMGGASKATILLANATGLKGEGGFASAANIATDVMAQFNIKAKDMTAAVDQISGTTIASKFTIDDYRLAIAQAGGVAGALGVEFDDFNAAIAAIAPSFASGSDAGTSFKVFLQRLQPVSNNAEDWMQSLGIITEEAGNRFYDASGNMKSMEEIAGVLAEAFGGLTEANKNEAASRIFGTDAMRAGLALAEGGTVIIRDFKKEIGKVNAEELAAKRMDTLKGSWEIFQGVVETLQLSLGQKFLPVARSVVEWSTDLAQKYGPPLIKWVENLMTKLNPLIADMTAWAKSVLPPLWQNIKNVTEAIGLIIKPITDNIGKFLSWKDVLGALGLLMAGPVLAAIGGVIGGLVSFAAPIAATIAAVAALRFAWEQDFMGIRTFTLSSLQKMSDWFFQESGIWKGTWEETLEYLKWWASTGWKMQVYFPLRSIFYDIQSDITTWSLFTQNKFAEWVQFGKDKFAGWKNDIIQTFTIWKDRVISFFQDTFGDTLKKITDWSTRTVSQINTWVQYWKDKLTPWRDWIVEKFQDVLDWWDEHIGPWIETGKNIVMGLWNGIKEKWGQFTEWWKGVWTGTVDWVKNLLGIHSPSTVFESIGADLMGGLKVGIDGASYAPLSAVDSLASQMKTKMDGMVDKVANSAQTIRDQINNMPALPQGYWSTPTGPTTPTMPIVTPPPNTNTGPDANNMMPTTTAALLSNLSNSLFKLDSTLNIGAVVDDIHQFAANTRQLLTAPNQPQLQGSSQTAMALQYLEANGLESRQVDTLLTKIQLLISTLQERGLGNQINITQAPDAALEQQQELGALVSYLAARFGG